MQSEQTTPPKSVAVDALKSEWAGICDAMNRGTYRGTEAEALARIEAIKALIAEVAALIAANAALEAKVAGLVEAVKPFDAVGGTLFSKNWNMSDIVFDGGPMRSDCLFFEDFLNLRAALATQEAGT